MEIFSVDVPVWVTLVMVAILLYTFLMSRDFLTFKRMGIPGPIPLPIVGNMPTIISSGMRDFDRNGIKRYGKVFGYYDILSPSLVIADKEMLQEILVKQFANFPDRRTVDGFSGDLEENLLSLKGEQWKRTRSILTPTYTSGKLRKIVPLIQDACDTMLKTSRNAMKQRDDGQVEIYRIFGGYTMDVVSSTAFGIHVDSQSNKDDPFIIHTKRILGLTLISPWLLVVMLLPFLKRLLMKIGVSVFPKDSQAYFRKLTFKMVKEREGRKEVEHKDLLHLMVDTQKDELVLDEGENNSNRSLSSPNKKSLTFNEIVGNTILFFIAGYETTSITLTFNAYNLATHPDCQEKLRQEINAAFGSRKIDYENLTKLRYLDMCLNETLRMYPPLMRFNRRCVKTTKIKDVTIPAGMTVTVPINYLHHDPDVWKSPESFIPERFSESEKSYGQMDFIPFGHGPRKCIALNLALLETKLMIAELVRNFRLSVGSKTDIPVKIHDRSVLRPANMWLKLENIRQTET